MLLPKPAQVKGEGIMAPRRVADFLHWAEAYHGRLAEFYRSRGKEAARPEAKVVLDYMARHQDALRRIIEDYEDGASKAVLDTWYKVSPDPKAFRDPEGAGFRADLTGDEAIDLALDLDRSLISMYEQLVRRAETPGLREVLENLLQTERAEEIRLLRSQSRS
jgi:rubrerythrin